MVYADAFNYLAGVIAVLAGSYMSITYFDQSLPPFLSGIAFVFLGLSHILNTDPLILQDDLDS